MDFEQLGGDSTIMTGKKGPKAHAHAVINPNQIINTLEFLTAKSTPYWRNCYNDDTCFFRLMMCRADLEVIPHSATSSASGDDANATIGWNSGVYPFQYETCAKTL